MNDRLQEFFTGFAEDTLGKKYVHRNWKVVDHAGFSRLRFYGAGAGERTAETLAVRQDSGTTILNASTLRVIGAHMVYGQEVLPWGETWHQKFFRENTRCLPVPFNALKEAGIEEEDFASLRVLEWGGAEQVIVQEERWRGDKKVKVPEERHYTGAALIEVKDAKFLFDVDRQELEYGHFNPFVAQLPDGCTAKIIAEAYDALVPREVREYLAISSAVVGPAAAAESANSVKRQGELFFIPEEPPAAPDIPDDLLQKAKYEPSYRSRSLFTVEEFTQADEEHREAQERVLSITGGPTRVNRHGLDFGVVREKTYGRGVVHHDGRQHHDLDLGETWHRVVPNTATRNFTVTGSVD